MLSADEATADDTLDSLIESVSASPLAEEPLPTELNHFAAALAVDDACRPDDYAALLLEDSTFLCEEEPSGVEALEEEAASTTPPPSRSAARYAETEVDEGLPISPDNEPPSTHVRAYHAFLAASGGACGGWDPRDHDTFRKIFTSFCAVQGESPSSGCVALPTRGAVIDASLAALPALYSRAQTAAHFDFVQQQEALLLAQRVALADWQQQRLVKRLAAESATKAALAKEAAKRRAREQAERLEKARELQSWKERQVKAEAEKKQAAARAVAKAASESARAREAAKAQLEQRMVTVRAARDAERQKKEEEAAAIKAEVAAAKQAAALSAAAVLAQAQARSAAALANRRSLADAKAKAEAERKARLERSAEKAAAAVSERVAHNPHRLLAPTAAARSREAETSCGGGGEGLPLSTLMRRGVPSWRAGL